MMRAASWKAGIDMDKGRTSLVAPGSSFAGALLLAVAISTLSTKLAASELPDEGLRIGLRNGYMHCLDEAGERDGRAKKCLVPELEFQNARMMKAYRHALGKVGVERAEGLVREQESWTRVLDESCAVQSDADGSQHGLADECVVRGTALRAFRLESIFEGTSLLYTASNSSGSEIGIRAQHDHCIERAGPSLAWMTDCGYEELAFQDRRLNDAYKRLISVTPEDQRMQVRKDERTWLRQKAPFCAPNDPAGLAGTLNTVSCETTQTAARATALERMLKNYEGR